MKAQRGQNQGRDYISLEGEWGLINIIFEMQKAVTNESAKENPSQGHPNQPVEKILYKLKELHEIED